MALAAYAAGLPAYVLIKVLTPGYFARENTVTPVKIASLCVAVNLVLNLVLMGPFAHVGIAVATAIAAWINAALLAGALFLEGAFAPATGVDLGLDHCAATKLLSRLSGLLARGGDPSAKHRYTVLREKFFGLVFVNLHRRFLP